MADPIRRTHLLLYLAKSVCGCAIAFGVSLLLPGKDVSWFLISIVLVLSPDSDEAIPLAITRIKANLIGSAASLAVLPMALPQMIGIGLAFCITILICSWLKLMAGSRLALACVVIIMFHTSGGQAPLDASLERVVSVVAGCLVATLITYAFHGRLAGGKILSFLRMAE